MKRDKMVLDRINDYKLGGKMLSNIDGDLVKTVRHKKFYDGCKN